MFFFLLQSSEVLDVVLGHLEALDFGLLGGLGHKEGCTRRPWSL
jgi:hypothetical protein